MMRRLIIQSILIAAMCLTMAGVFAGKARAACAYCSIEVTKTEGIEWYTPGSGTVPVVWDHVDAEFNGHRHWLVGVLWAKNILPSLMMMADQFSAVAIQQAEIIGTFIDAKHQMETQASLQKIRARAHKDYHPSAGMCEFGSTTKSLAASERKSEFNALHLSRRSMDRALGKAGAAAASGGSADINGRLRQFRLSFCDPADNNNGLAYLCDHNQEFGEGRIGAHRAQNPGEHNIEKYKEPALDRANKDIDFMRTVDAPWTLKIDFTDDTLTEEEEEVMALASNLYGHEVFFRPQLDKTIDGKLDAQNLQSAYMDARSLLAKRNVAENSFNAITAMKSEGLPGSKDYLAGVLESLGIHNEAASGSALADTIEMLGENPSYYAQMEVLTKKIYQNPAFYTDLYDKPANVERKEVALQAIGLMQKFDIFKSYLRNEASLSVLLELAVTDIQRDIENQIGD